MIMGNSSAAFGPTILRARLKARRVARRMGGGLPDLAFTRDQARDTHQRSLRWYYPLMYRASRSRQAEIGRAPPILRICSFGRRAQAARAEAIAARLGRRHGQTKILRRA